MDAVKGTCSICGGDVVGHVGPWHAVVPPPPARCTKCGATEARGPVIPMVPTMHVPVDGSYCPQCMTMRPFHASHCTLSTTASVATRQEGAE